MPFREVEVRKRMRLCLRTKTRVCHRCKLRVHIIAICKLEQLFFLQLIGMSKKITRNGINE